MTAPRILHHLHGNRSMNIAYVFSLAPMCTEIFERACAFDCVRSQCLVEHLILVVRYRTRLHFAQLTLEQSSLALVLLHAHLSVLDLTVLEYMPIVIAVPEVISLSGERFASNRTGKPWGED